MALNFKRQFQAGAIYDKLEGYSALRKHSLHAQRACSGRAPHCGLRQMAVVAASSIDFSKLISPSTSQEIVAVDFPRIVGVVVANKLASFQKDAQTLIEGRHLVKKNACNVQL